MPTDSTQRNRIVLVGFVSLFFSVFTVEAAKKRCQPVDLREKLPPIRDQGALGWCYAHVAADLASFYTGENISPFGIVVDYDRPEGGVWKLLLQMKRNGIAMFKHKTWHLKLYQKEGGQIGEALNASVSKGLCLERELPTEGHFMGLRSLLVMVDSLKKNQLRATSPIDVYYDNGDFAGEVQCNNLSIISSLFPTLDIDTISRILERAEKNAFVKRLAPHACKARIPFDKKFRTTFFPSKEMFIEKVHSLLNNKDIVGIGYDSSILYRFSQEGGNHASSIVGRRWNESTQQCQLLLRNTYGASCKRNYRKKYDCDGGYLWIDEHALATHSHTMTYLPRW